MLPNHYHLLIRIKDIDSLPREYISGKKKIHQPFLNLFNAYTKAFNKEYNRTGSLFQEHLHRIKINSEEYFKELVLYIHLNPEKHGISDDFSTYNHSSYKNHLSEKPSLLLRKEIIDYFEDIENFKLCQQNRKIKLELLKTIDSLDY